jgi:hypothetical protein
MFFPENRAIKKTPFTCFFPDKKRVAGKKPATRSEGLSRTDKMEITHFVRDKSRQYQDR